MWNNLKSDIYRALHAKSFWIILFSLMVLYGMILTDSGVQTNTVFAQFYPESDSFTDFLYYLPKSGLFITLALLFLAIFTSDEYTFDYTKNIYAINVRKWKLVISKYIFSVLLITLYTLVLVFEAYLIHGLIPMRVGNFDILNFIIYTLMQIGFIAAVSSFIMILTHLIRSRVLSVLISLVYGMMMWYMFLGGITQFMFGDAEILRNTLYQASGELPRIFSWEGYQYAFFILIGNTLLYNGISYFVLKKKDM